MRLACPFQLSPTQNLLGDGMQVSARNNADVVVDFKLWAAGDGATPLFDVRLAGAAANAAPVLSGTPTLLTHANYSDGCHEVAIAATAANGFAAGNTYLVFVTLTISSVTPAAMVGSFTIAPVVANATQILGTAVSTPATAGVLDVNIKRVNNVTVTGAGTAGNPWGP